MEWLTAIRKSIDYIETHLKEDITVQDIANQGTDTWRWNDRIRASWQDCSGWDSYSYDSGRLCRRCRSSSELR